MSQKETEIYGVTSIKWPTNLKAGKRQERFVALWGFIDPTNRENSQFKIRYFVSKKGACKGEIPLSKSSTVRLFDYEEANSQGINNKVNLGRDQFVICLSTTDTSLYFRDIRPTRHAQETFIEQIQNAINILGNKSPLNSNPQIDDIEDNKASENDQTLEKKENTGKEEEQITAIKEDNNEKVNDKHDEEKHTEIITEKEEKGSEINDDNTDENVDLNDVNEQSKESETSTDPTISTASSTEEKQETKEEPNKEETNNEQISAEIANKEETKTEEASKEDINNEAKIKQVMSESNLKGYGYFTETNSSTEQFYIVDPKNKLLFAFDREKMEKFRDIEDDQTLSEEERKPTHSYNFAKESTEVSRISYSSVHSDSALKVLFQVKENSLILCPSNANSKKNEQDFYYALKDISKAENIEVPVPPSNGCCTIV